MIPVKETRPNDVQPELDTFEEYFLEAAKKELEKAKEALADVSYRRARAQELLRESVMFYDKLPKGFTDPEFVIEYNKTYSKAYRGH